MRQIEYLYKQADKKSFKADIQNYPIKQYEVRLMSITNIMREIDSESKQNKNWNQWTLWKFNWT